MPLLVVILVLLVISLFRRLLPFGYKVGIENGVVVFSFASACIMILLSLTTIMIAVEKMNDNIRATITFDDNLCLSLMMTIGYYISALCIAAINTLTLDVIFKIKLM